MRREVGIVGTDWRGSSGGLPICGSGDRCGLWSYRESLHEFTSLFFWLLGMHLFF